MTDRVPSRAPYQGLVQTFEYNRPFYVRAAAGAMAAILISFYAPPGLRMLIVFGTGIAVFWTCSSVLVSHYIYDQSGLYKLCWLAGCLSQTPER